MIASRAGGLGFEMSEPETDERCPGYAGWRVVAALFVVEMAMFGFGLYGQGIYVTGLRLLNDWPTALIASGTTVCLVLGSLLSVFVSDLLRHFGPRRLLLAGVAALTAGLLLLASADTVVQLYAGFVVLSLAWVGLGTVTAAAIIGTWFDRKLGLAISLAFAGATCSGIVVTPSMVALVEAIGFRNALSIAAAGAAVVLSAVATFVKFPPAQAHASDTAALLPQPLSRPQLLKDAGFWSVTAPFALALMVQVAFIVHQIAILTPAMGFQGAGGAVSLTTAMALAGRIGLGVFVDRIDPRRAAAVSIFSQAVALTLIAQSRGGATLLLASAIFGFSIGNLITLPALVVQREFAPNAFGPVLGLSMAVCGVVNACGPAAMGLLRDLTGGYAPALFAGAALQALAAALLSVRSASRYRASTP